MAKPKAEYQLVIRTSEHSPQRTLHSFGAAIMNARAQVTLGKHYGYWVNWQIIRRSDKVVVAQSK